MRYSLGPVTRTNSQVAWSLVGFGCLRWNMEYFAPDALITNHVTSGLLTSLHYGQYHNLMLNLCQLV